MKSLESRIKDAFSMEGSHSATGYLEAIRGNWRTAEEGLRRATFGLILTAVIFVLISDAGIGEFDLGPIKLTDLRLVGRGIPVAFSYLTFEWVAFAVLINRLGSIHDGVILHYFPALDKGDLHIPLAPAMVSLPAELRLLGGPGRAQTAMRTLTSVKTVLFLILLVGAHVYFYQQEFSSFGLRDIGVWITLVMSLYLITQTGLLILKFFKDPSWT